MFKAWGGAWPFLRMYAFHVLHALRSTGISHIMKLRHVPSKLVETGYAIVVAEGDLSRV